MNAIDEAQEEAKTDMTPMIDCVFLLIIFFLCIDFKVLESKLPAYLPKDKGSNTTEEEPSNSSPFGSWSPRSATSAIATRTATRSGKTRAPARLAKRPISFRATRSAGTSVPSRSTRSPTSRRSSSESPTTAPPWQPDKEKPGDTKPMPIVIEPQVNACYVDVANTVDAVTAAGFKEVNFGGGMGSNKAPRDQ